MPKRIEYHKSPGQRANTDAYSRQPWRQEDKNFYSSMRWARLRAAKLAEAPLCQKCGVALAVHVHHIKPRKTHPDLAYDFDNLESNCHACHNAQPER